jgi:filamentous hemagglutinin
VFDALGRTVDEAAAFRAVPQVTFNQIAGSQFERQVLDALGFVGATKNTVVTPSLLSDGSVINTIIDSTGRNVGGFLEIKNVQDLSLTRQLDGIIGNARAGKAPFNLVVSPTTKTVSRNLRDAVKETGGGIFIFDPATGLIKPFGA